MLNLSIAQTVTYRRPKEGTKTGRVWEIADEITHEKCRPAKRREVMERFTAEKGSANTASTQYQYWKNWYDRQSREATEASDKPVDIEPLTLKVTPDGRILIPLEMREAMCLGKDSHVTARVIAGELRLITPAVAVTQIQNRMKQYKTPGTSIVDQFLSDRRTLWGET